MEHPCIRVRVAEVILRVQPRISARVRTALTRCFSGNHRVIGDMLCLGGSMLYAVANVSEEFLVKQHSRMEYLGMVGLFGSLISGVQLSVHICISLFCNVN